MIDYSGILQDFPVFQQGANAAAENGMAEEAHTIPHPQNR
jgi:hypothetical protein